MGWGRDWICKMSISDWIRGKGFEKILENMEVSISRPHAY